MMMKMTALSALIVGSHAGCGRFGFDELGDLDDDNSLAPDAAPTLMVLPLTLDRFMPAEALLDFPLLVHLTEAQLPANRVGPGAANLRFRSSGGAVLAHEIEPSAAGVTAWVRLPSWSGVQTIVLEVEPPDIEVPATGSVWSDAFVAVHHFADGIDATGHGHDLIAVLSAPVGEPGIAGQAASFVRVDVDSGDCIGIADAPGLHPASITVSAWQRSNSFVEGSELKSAVTRQAGAGTGDDFAIGVRASEALDVWTHRAVIYATTDDINREFSNGTEFKTGTGMSSSAAPVLIGCDRNVALLSEFFDGGIDEVRIANVARSPAWLLADAASGMGNVITVGVLAAP